MPARLARASDISSLPEMFAASDVSAAVQTPERAEAIRQDTLQHPGVQVFVSGRSDRIAATCMLVTAPSLLRAGRCNVLENVVTHPAFQGQGHGRAVVTAALDRAWTRGCCHVLMQSGRKDPWVHAFYQGLGFRPGLRTA
ncbi:GNAT family N-acetyltransferase, partial [Falsiroseomonas sp. E2-1-a4]|uniref:GNAT family N-acetyltransferase n=1 Tax=Falsiroseomonas sp. E2-1-a4 TaxID=3239299 RepID=UPI003F33E0EC